MNKIVLRYELKLGINSFLLPDGCKVLTAQYQKAKECISLWVLADEEHELKERFFGVYGTGHIIPENIELDYINTVQERDGVLVWHVFEVKHKWF